MYGRLPSHKETGMRWFDIYLGGVVIVFAVVRFFTIFSSIGMKNYHNAVLMLVSAMLNISIIIKFKPYKKSMVRDYPKNLFYLIIADNALAILNSLINSIIVVITWLSYQDYITQGFVIQNFVSTAWVFVAFILNTVYFVKRKNYFTIDK